MTPDERLEHLARLWRRERQAARARAHEERAGHDLAARVERGTAMAHLTIADVQAAPGGRTVLWLAPRDRHELERARVGPGDPVRLWRQAPDEPEAVRGVVSRRTREKLAVMIDGEPPEDARYKLDLDAPEATFDRGDRAIARFGELPRKDPRAPLKDVLLGYAAPTFEPTAREAPLDPALNDAQRRAVERALDATTVGLILGPPGTGKTRTLAEVVRRAVARGERVLVTAASNLAVDNLAERLASFGAPVLRLGHPARVTDAVEALTLDHKLEATPQWALARDWMREAAQIRHRARQRFGRGAIGHRDRRATFAEAGRLSRDARAQLDTAKEAILARHPIVCATAAGAEAGLLRGASFDRVVLDEATQAVDPMALVALGRAPKATLAGDPHQLPPTVIDLAAERDGLGSTFFERIAASSPDAVTMLEVQHRMHAALMAFPSEHVYGGRLIAHPRVAAHRLAELDGVAEDPDREGPLVYLDTAGKGWTEERAEDDPSLFNPGQAERVVEEARRLLARGLAPSDLAVITPYLAQARRLSAALEPELDRGLEVGTVDGFQGREKEAVIVDLVRSNDRGELGFLTDERRLNVAITRARRFLMVVGDSATVARHPFHAALLDHAERTGAHRSAWVD